MPTDSRRSKMVSRAKEWLIGVWWVVGKPKHIAAVRKKAKMASLDNVNLGKWS